MPSKDEKNRRREMARNIRDQQRGKARDAFPASPLILKRMFDCLDGHLEESECDHTMKLTREFIRANGLDETSFTGWLNSNGGHCDCEVLNNVEQVVSEAIPGFDDLGAGSVQ